MADVWGKIVARATANSTCVTCRRDVQHEKAHIPRIKVACSFDCAQSAVDSIIIQGGTAVRVTSGGPRNRDYFVCSLSGEVFGIHWVK